ncbi:unnamed protein product, partial [Mycena citricolor]
VPTPTPAQHQNAVTRMSGKRKRVPRALHAELSEYSSLIRTLHTHDTLDLAKHITLPAPQPTSRRRSPRTLTSSPPLSLDAGVVVGADNDRDDDSDYRDEEEEEEERRLRVHQKDRRTPSEGSVGPPRSDPVASDDGDFQEGSSKDTLPSKADTWTRWPLLMSSVHIPEWSFEEEIAAIARRVLENGKSDAPPDGVGAEDDEEQVDEDTDEDGEIPSYIAHSASAFLSSILALLAHHSPSRGETLQNRLQPLRWQNVLDIVASCTDVDPEVIDNVKARMEVVYGPHDSPALARLETRAKYKARLRRTMEQAEHDLLAHDVDEPDPQTSLVSHDPT